MRAVVVDDSSAMRAYLKMILTKAGFEVAEHAMAGKGYSFCIPALHPISCFSTGTCRR